MADGSALHSSSVRFGLDGLFERRTVVAVLERLGFSRPICRYVQLELDSYYTEVSPFAVANILSRCLTYRDEIYAHSERSVSVDLEVILESIGWDVRRSSTVHRLCQKANSLLREINSRETAESVVALLIDQVFRDSPWDRLRPGDRITVPIHPFFDSSSPPATLSVCVSIVDVCVGDDGELTDTGRDALDRLPPVPASCTRLFHGTSRGSVQRILEIIDPPRDSKKRNDFGHGFYTTPHFPLAAQHAHARSLGDGCGIIVYDVPDSMFVTDCEEFEMTSDDVEARTAEFSRWEQCVAKERERWHRNSSHPVRVYVGPIVAHPSEHQRACTPLSVARWGWRQQYVFVRDPELLGLFTTSVVFSGRPGGMDDSTSDASSGRGGDGEEDAEEEEDERNDQCR